MMRIANKAAPPPTPAAIDVNDDLDDDVDDGGDEIICE